MRTFADFRQHYLAQGYSSLGISDRTGAEILRNGERGRVVKITIAGKDPSAIFSAWVLEHPHDHLPRVFDIIHGESAGAQQALNWHPCAIEMEELLPMTDDEREQYSHWIEAYLRWRSDPVGEPDDPLGLFRALQAIFDEADGLQGAIGVEVRKPRNVMAREVDGQRTLVMLDPWY